MQAPYLLPTLVDKHSFANFSHPVNLYIQNGNDTYMAAMNAAYQGPCDCHFFLTAAAPSFNHPPNTAHSDMYNRLALLSLVKYLF